MVVVLAATAGNPAYMAESKWALNTQSSWSVDSYSLELGSRLRTTSLPVAMPLFWETVSAILFFPY